MNLDFKSYRVRGIHIVSLFCLIPIWGIILGIILITNLVIRKGSKKMIFVILAEMLISAGISIAIENYLKYDLEYGNESGRLLAAFTQNDIDILAKDLETYRQEKGHYPDSLEEMQEIFPGLSIVDAMLGRNPNLHKKDIEYHYFRTGQKYVLFSCGIDGIPNTKDDIYPRGTLMQKRTKMDTNGRTP